MLGAHLHIVVVLVVRQLIRLDGRVGVQGTPSVMMLFPQGRHYDRLHPLAGDLVGEVRGGRAAVVLIAILAHGGGVDLNGYGLVVRWQSIFAGVQGRLVWKHWVVVRLLGVPLAMVMILLAGLVPLLVQQSSSLCASIVAVTVAMAVVVMMMVPVVVAVAVMVVCGNHTTAASSLQPCLGGIVSLPATAVGAQILPPNQSLLVGGRRVDDDHFQGRGHAAIVLALATATGSGQHLVVVVVLKGAIIMALAKVQHLEVLVVRPGGEKVIVATAAHGHRQRELVLLGMGCM